MTATAAALAADVVAGSRPTQPLEDRNPVLPVGDAAIHGA